jgi:YtkA-like
MLKWKGDQNHRSVTTKKGLIHMKKNQLLMLFILFILTSVAACSQQKEKIVEAPQILDVQLAVNPVQGKMNEVITFEAKVMYGEKEVTDPDEVTFEVWRAHDNKHEKIEPKNKGNGVFSLEKSFAMEGTYYIYAHVTAEKMHYMPKKEFVIGQPSEPEVEGASKGMENNE